MQILIIIAPLFDGFQRITASRHLAITIKAARKRARKSVVVVVVAAAAAPIWRQVSSLELKLFEKGEIVEGLRMRMAPKWPLAVSAQMRANTNLRHDRACNHYGRVSEEQVASDWTDQSRGLPFVFGSKCRQRDNI